MSAWGRSACYPQSTSYPLSDGPSIHNHRITMSVYRPRSTCSYHRQTRLCHRTPRTVTKRTEHTFESLRYLFGGDHPSQTTHQTMSPSYNRLETGYRKGGISRTIPRPLARPLQNLPPILHILYPITMLSY